MDWIKWSFVLAFYFLLRSDSIGKEKVFRYALRLTIQLGGDTDTNACIVSGLMGALVGLSNIPPEMISRVLGYTQ